jgi:hypothetical protein
VRAHPLFRARAERDDQLLLVGGEVDSTLTEVVGVEADRPGQRERAGLVVGPDPRVEQDGLKSLLQLCLAPAACGLGA